MRGVPQLVRGKAEVKLVQAEVGEIGQVRQEIHPLPVFGEADTQRPDIFCYVISLRNDICE